MNHPVPGLHRLFQGSNSVAKVELRVQPGDVIDASDDVAAQLAAAGFKTEAELDAPKGAVDTATPVDESVSEAPKSKRRK